MKQETLHWYAIYTQARWEKKVHRLLQEAGYESYCPLNKVQRRWSDRMKTVEEPLFRSYVFVRITDRQRTAVREMQGVVNFVHWLGKPAIVRDEEIAEIRRFLDEYTDVEVTRLNEKIEPGTRLRITTGFMMGNEAVAIRETNKFVEVIIESIGFKLKASIEKRRLERV